MLDVRILATPCAVTTFDERYLNMEAEMRCGFYPTPCHKPQITIGRKGWPKREAGRRVSQSFPNLCPRERRREIRNMS